MRTLKKIKNVLGLTLLGTAALQAQTIEEGRKLTDGEKYPKAAVVFQKVIAAQPTNAQAYFYAADNFFKWGKSDSAKIVYSQGIAAVPKSGINYAGLGQVQWALKDTAIGAQNMNKAITLSKFKDPIVLTKVAEAYINYDYKKLDYALTLLTRAEKKNYKNTTIHTLKGDAYSLQGKTDDAYSSYETAYDLDSTSIPVLLKRGRMLANAGNNEEALEYFISVNVIDSTFAPAYKEKAYLFEKEKNYEAAIDQLRKYLVFNENIKTRNDLARNLFLFRKYEEAIEEVKLIQETDTTNLYHYRYLGYSYFETSLFDSSAAALQKLIAKAEMDKSFKLVNFDYYYYGKSLFRIGKDSLAIIYLEKALKNDSNLVDLNTDLGNSYSRMKKYAEAIKYFERKVIKKGDNANSKEYNSLAMAYYYNKEYAKADSIFTKVIALSPDEFTPYVWKAKANEKLDPEYKLGKAIIPYETVLAKANPEKHKKEMINAHNYLGYHYIQVKNFKKAKFHYLEIQKLDPENPKAKLFLSTKEAKAVK